MIQGKMLKPVELNFNGRAGEYFRIWIVNILLTIVTLGIYSAWAKVRNKQYFYGNTLLDGSPFEYSASPMAILKGRLVVAAIILIYSVTVKFFPLAEGLFFLAFFIALPWLVMRSLMFNARYSSYRNLHFNFEKNLSDSIKTFIGLGLLLGLTLGLIYPYYAHAIQAYRVNNHSYGQFLFSMKSVVKAFYKYYLLALLIVITILVIAIIIIGVSLGDSLALFTGGRGLEDAPSGGAEMTVILYMFIPVFLLAYSVAYAYVKTRVFNLVWTNTELRKPVVEAGQTSPDVPLMAFKGELQIKQIFWIYITNLLAIICSMGLLIPWAKIRMAKYRIENLSVLSIADLKVITAREREQVGTIGSEMGDIMDIDLGM